MSTNETVTKTIGLLEATLCQHKDGCKEGVEKWWPSLSKKLFDKMYAKPICKELSKGQCDADTFKASKWNCEACTHDVALVGALYFRVSGHVAEPFQGIKIPID